MKKGVLIAAAVLLTGCSCGEAQRLEQPYNVETARTAQPTPDTPESHRIEVAPATVEIPVEEVEAVTEPEKVAEEPEVSCSKLRQVAVIATFEEAVAEALQQSCDEVAMSCEPEPCIDYPEGEAGNYYEDIPDETSQVWEQPEMQYVGYYYITHYSAEACGNAIGAGQPDGGLQEGISIAVPEEWMLHHWFYIENHGTYRADDISPDGIFDIFHWYTADAVGADYQNVYLVG